MEATKRCSLQVAGVNQWLETEGEEAPTSEGALSEETVYQPQKELVEVLPRESEEGMSVEERGGEEFPWSAEVSRVCPGCDNKSQLTWGHLQV